MMTRDVSRSTHPSHPEETGSLEVLPSSEAIRS